MSFKLSSLLVFLMLAQISLAQNFKDRWKAEICACFKENGPPEHDYRTPLDNCYNSTLPKYETALNALIDPSSDVPAYEQARVLGERIFENMQSELIESCDVYFDFMEGVQKETLEYLKEAYPKSTFPEINNAVLKESSPEVLCERGNYYFFNNDFEKALADYQKYLEVNPGNTQAKFCMAWIYEIQGNYTKAISLYEEVYLETGESGINTILAMARRKSKE